MELLSTLGIDWKLLVTQLINFLVLIGVMTVLVYKPILRMLDERRERVRTAMEDAKRVEAQAKELEKIRTDHLKKVDQQAGQILEQVKRQAEDAKRDILDGAQKEATALLAKAREQLDAERSKLVSDLQKSLSGVVVNLAAKIVEREFSDADQQRMLQGIEKDLPALLR